MAMIGTLQQVTIYIFKKCFDSLLRKNADYRSYINLINIDMLIMFLFEDIISVIRRPTMMYKTLHRRPTIQ
jgi:hypothetical protein